MAKLLLRIFGGGSIALGIAIILAGVDTKDGLAFSIALYAGGAFLLFGAPLLGFARVIGLLEQVVRNTAELRQPDNASDPRPGNYSTASVIKQDTHLGFPFTLHGDGMVVSRSNGDVATWRNEEEFRAWAAMQPPR